MAVLEAVCTPGAARPLYETPTTLGLLENPSLPSLHSLPLKKGDTLENIR